MQNTLLHANAMDIKANNVYIIKLYSTVFK